MYIVSFVIPVPEENLSAYRAWSDYASDLLMEFGCQDIMEAMEDRVPEGSLTDYRRAVAAKPGEKIVITWQVWPDKAHVDRVEEAMATDPRFDPPGAVPFDQKRLIMGGFSPILVKGSLRS